MIAGGGVTSNLANSAGKRSSAQCDHFSYLCVPEGPERQVHHGLRKSELKSSFAGCIISSSQHLKHLVSLDHRVEYILIMDLRASFLLFRLVQLNNSLDAVNE